MTERTDACKNPQRTALKQRAPKWCLDWSMKSVIRPALAGLGSLLKMLVLYFPTFHSKMYIFPQLDNSEMEYVLWPMGDNGMVGVIWLHLQEVNHGCLY